VVRGAGTLRRLTTNHLPLTYRQRKGRLMLWTIVAIFLILWLLGFSMSVGGGLIHLLLVVALVVVVINLLRGRRGVI
jgi:Family of unknown function (DUF5670)